MQFLGKFSRRFLFLVKLLLVVLKKSSHGHVPRLPFAINEVSCEHHQPQEVTWPEPDLTEGDKGFSRDAWSPQN